MVLSRFAATFTGCNSDLARYSITPSLHHSITPSLRVTGFEDEDEDEASGETASPKRLAQVPIDA
jgi:hypothetical protein